MLRCVTSTYPLVVEVPDATRVSLWNSPFTNRILALEELGSGPRSG